MLTMQDESRIFQRVGWLGHLNLVFKVSFNIYSYFLIYIIKLQFWMLHGNRKKCLPERIGI
jgi:hypothetical protein